jgi:hypothetical protein
LGPSPDQACWPRPKLTIKSLLIAIAVFALSNCLAVWAVRIRPNHQSPEDLLMKTGFALFLLNSYIGFIIFYLFVSNWMRQVIWYRRTGNVRPMPSAKAMSRHPDLAWFSLSWVTFRCKLISIGLFRNNNPWLLIPTVLGVVLTCRVMFLAAEASSTNRPTWAHEQGVKSADT